VPQTPCCHCCDELTARCCRRRLILTLVVNAVCVLSHFYFREVACINSVQYSAVVIRYRRRGFPIRNLFVNVHPLNVQPKIHNFWLDFINFVALSLTLLFAHFLGQFLSNGGDRGLRVITAAVVRH